MHVHNHEHQNTGIGCTRHSTAALLSALPHAAWTWLAFASAPAQGRSKGCGQCVWTIKCNHTELYRSTLQLPVAFNAMHGICLCMVHCGSTNTTKHTTAT